MIALIKKTLKLLLICITAFILFNASAIAASLDFSFLPITGLIDAIQNAETEATELIPDEIKSFVYGLSEKIKSIG